MPAPINIFHDYPRINQAYGNIRNEFKKYLDNWNKINQDLKSFKALDLYIMAFFHYCIPEKLKPLGFGAGATKSQDRLKGILYPYLRDPDKLTEDSYLKTISNIKNIQIFLERLVAGRSENPKVMPYIIPGSSPEFKDLYDARYIGPGTKMKLRIRSKDYLVSVSSKGKLEIDINGKLRIFDSTQDVGKNGFNYAGFAQWKSFQVIESDGSLTLLDTYRKRFENERPFKEHFDSVETTRNSAKTDDHTKTDNVTDHLTEEFYEGSIRRISVEIRERDATARMACIEHYQAKCFICKFDFGKFYGSEAEGFIHVHHREQLAKAAGRRKVDPIEDLVPLCPNCHSVVHLRKKAYEVDEVKKMVERQKSKRRAM